jgi:hypothetical protein
MPLTLQDIAQHLDSPGPREQVLRSLVAHPAWTISVLDIAAQSGDGVWDLVETEELMIGPEHERLFLSVATINYHDEEVTGPQVHAASKKVAAQRAATAAVLEALREETRVPVDWIPSKTLVNPHIPSERHVPEDAPGKGFNSAMPPVAALGNLGSQEGIIPEYVGPTRHGGSDNMPAHMCTCTFGPIVHTSVVVGPKKACKQTAAYLVLCHIREHGLP